MTFVAARPRSVAVAVWALLVAATAVVASLPGDPETIPWAWLAVLAVVGVLAYRGSSTAYACLVALNVGLLATVVLLSTPAAASVWAFYALVAAALAALAGIPLLARRPAAVDQVA